MHCPNCQEEMDYVNLDSRSILHCVHCGCSFFEEHIIDHIRPESAYKLKEDTKEEFVSGGDKHCPKDNAILSPIGNQEESHNITLLQCGRCKGIFTYPDDLTKYAVARQTHTLPHKKTYSPSPAFRTLLVLSVVGLISFASISQTGLINNVSRFTQASETIKTLSFSTKGTYLFLYFTTSQPYISTIIFKNPQNGETVVKPVSKEPAKIHMLSTGEVSWEDYTLYSVVLTDQSGRVTVSKEKPIQVNPQ